MSSSQLGPFSARASGPRFRLPPVLLNLLLLATTWIAVAQAAAAAPITVPFAVDEDRRLVVDLALQGGPVKALVDTGTTPNIILQPAAAERVKLRYVPFLRTARASGVDGKGARGRLALVKIVRLGATAGDWDVPGVVIETPILKYDALLGMGLLDDYDVEFDFQRREIRLAERERTHAVGPSGFANCMPDRPSLSLVGRCGEAMVFIDTGAKRTTMNPAMAARLGLPAGAEGRSEPGRGASGRAVPATRYEHPVEVAGLRLPSILVADLPDQGGCKSPCARMQLGMDALGGLSGMTVTRSHIAFRP